MANTTNFGWETPDDTDLVKDGALAMRTLGNAIDTSLVDLKGGTTGQVLSKNTNTDMDFVWITQNDADAIQNSIVDAKGDLITATADNTPARLAVGTNGQVLTADSTTATGLKWAAAAGGGKVLQVVNATYSVATSNSTATYADTGLSASITPSSTASKILVLVSQSGLRKSANSGDNAVMVRLLRGATEIVADFAGVAGYQGGAGTLYIGAAANLSYLDSPSTTSSTTYKTQFRNFDNGPAVTVQQNSGVSSMTLLEIGA